MNPAGISGDIAAAIQSSSDANSWKSLESAVCECQGPLAASPGTTVLRWPMTNSSGPLNFWRLFRRRGLGRTHGRLMMDGNSYWK